LAKRDEGLRSALVEVVEKSKAKAKAIVLMDGLRSQVAIRKEAEIDQGALSRLVKELRERGLVTASDQPN
jgi:DNA-binding MarR family transcriptional regulator